MDTQQVLGNAGAPFIIDWNGKKFKVYFRTQKLKAQFEEWAKRMDILELVAMKDILPQDDYQKEFDKLMTAIRSNEYSISKERCKKLMETPKGARELFRLQLGEEGKKLSEEDLDACYNANAELVATYFATYTGKLEGVMKDLGWDPENDEKGENIDPKALKAALEKAGLL